MNICFDIDGCLIDRDKKMIEENVTLLKVLCKSHKVFLWSGNGWNYALTWADELGILEIICGVFNKYGTFRPDIAFDDQEIDLGKINIQI